MAREYAHRKHTTRRNQASHQLVLIVLSFLAGYLAAYLCDAEHLRLFINKQISTNSESPKKQTPKPKTHQTAQAAKPKFEFYTLLANEKAGAKTQTALRPKPLATPPSAASPTLAPETADVPKKPTEKAKPLAVKITEGKPLLPVAAVKSNFVVQVAAFNAKKDAEQMRANLTLKGYSVSIVPIKQTTGTWFRVILGPYSSKLAAEKAQITVARNEHLRGMIRTA
jgi:cell division protein FtsN